MPRSSINAVSVAFFASMAVSLSAPPASAQPLGQGNLFRYELDPDEWRCYQIDPLRNYRVVVSISNCMQSDPEPPIFPFWPTGWVFVTDTGDDHSTISSGDITIVYGLDPNQGLSDIGLAGMTPSNPEYSLAGDDMITARNGSTYFASSFQTVPIIELPQLLPDHDLSMVDFSDPFSVVHVTRTFAPLDEIYFPCMSDMNNDGVQDLTDISAFIGSFLAGQFGADFNADGVYDLTDLVAFIDGFVAGCP